MSKETFKSFVKSNPSIIKSVNNREHTWQELYELYDMVGEESNEWDKFKNNENKSIINSINLDNIQTSLNSIEKFLGIISELIPNKEEKKEQVKPIYQHLDD